MTIYYIEFALNFLILSTGLMYSLWRRRIYSVIFVGLIVFHISSIFDHIFLFASFTENTLITGQLFMLLANFLFTTSLICIDTVLVGKAPIVVKYYHDPKIEIKIWRRYLTSMILLSMTTIVILFRGGSSIGYTDWENLRMSSDIFRVLSQFFGFIIVPAIWIALFRKKYVACFLLTAATIVIFMVLGSRAMLLTFVAAIFLNFLLIEKFTIKHILFGGGLLFAGLLLHTLVRLIRGLGLFALLSIVYSGGLFSYLNKTYETVDLSGGEKNIYRAYYYVIDKDYDKYPYKSGVTLVRMAMLYIPRSLLPEIKPRDITYQIWSDSLQEGYLRNYENVDLLISLERMGAPGSLHPTVWGDAYANAGIWGMILYPVIFAVIFVTLERGVRVLSIFSFFAIGPILSVGYLMIARGNVVIGLGYIGYIIPIVLMIFVIAGVPMFSWRVKKAIRRAHLWVRRPSREVPMG